MNQGEGRARRRRGCAKGRSQTFHKLGLPAPEITGQRDNITRLDGSRELAAKRLGFVRAIGNERSHGEDVEKLSC